MLDLTDLKEDETHSLEYIFLLTDGNFVFFLLNFVSLLFSLPRPRILEGMVAAFETILPGTIYLV